MDFGKAFSYVFEDPDWLKKVGLGGVISLVPILNFASAGYGLEVARRIINNDPRPLPEWDNIGDKLVKGLLLAVIQVVYMLPMLLFVCIIQVVNVVVLGAASSSSSSDSTAATLVTAVMACFGCLAFLYSLFAGLVMPAAIGNYAAKGQLGAAFRFGEVWGLVQKNLGLYVMVLIVTIVAGLVASLGTIACIIGVVFTAFYAVLIMYHAYGQAYREASTNIGLV
jgi:Protein of unknown function (DUF4013)